MSETEVAKPKLSNALRLADAMELPDLRGDWLETNVDHWGGEKPPCCAIGGANIASGRTPIVTGEGVDDDGLMKINQEGEAVERWARAEGRIESLSGFVEYDEWLDRLDSSFDLVICPAPPSECAQPGQGRYLDNIVVHLYDDHLWTRTEIADWLDSRG